MIRAETLKFTSKERDAETGLDYFGARYMASAQGRFTSPDGPLLDQSPGDPQSWNLYGYVRNNHLVFTDPSGNASIVGPNGDYDDGGTGQKRSEGEKPQEFTFDGSTNVVTSGADSDGLSTYGQLFVNQTAMRRDASNQMIAVVGAGSAPAGVASGTGAVVAVIDGVAYTWESLLVLGPEALAKLVPAGKITQELSARIQPYLGGGAEVFFGKGRLVERTNLLGGWRQIPGRIYTWAERLPHYHRRFPGPGGSINRHRPWDVPGIDKVGSPLFWWKRY